MADRFHLADLFETVARTVPDRIALISDSARLTFAELDERCDRLAVGLAAQGITQGDTVGLYLQNGPAYIETFIAA
jgi:fatty-acyl-CoA synthase